MPSGLSHRRYAACTGGNDRQCVTQFGRRLGKQRIELRSIDEGVVRPFRHRSLSGLPLPATVSANRRHRHSGFDSRAALALSPSLGRRLTL